MGVTAIGGLLSGLPDAEAPFHLQGEAGKPGKSGERGPPGPQVSPAPCNLPAGEGSRKAILSTQVTVGCGGTHVGGHTGTFT